MRGLEARVLLARGRIALLAYPDRHSNDYQAALTSAYWTGVRDASAGRTDAPLMFADELELLDAWHTGREDRERTLRAIQP